MSNIHLDQHYVTIRKRTIGEIFDLTMAVIRSDGLNILLCLLPFAVPFAMINHLIMSKLCNSFFMLDIDSFEWFVIYFFGILMISLFQVPFGASLSIIYLGRRVFSARNKPTISEILFAWVEAIPHLIVFAIFLLPLILRYECLSEIIALERSPIFSKKKDQMTTFRRLKNFHRDRFGEQFIMLLPILLFGLMVGPGVCILVSVAFHLCIGPIPVYFTVYFGVLAGVVVWAFIMFLVVFHFLRYLDMRIEREGWDVELVFRAERSRMTES